MSLNGELKETGGSGRVLF